MKQDDVRIICPAMGGNFGTRGDTLIAVTSGLLAQKTGTAGAHDLHAR